MTDVLDRLRKALADRYAIEREIGSGGMATVYLAEDLKHHRQVAIKVLRPDLAATLGPERFLREIEIAAQLQHPHILPLLDSGEADGFLYYVMPFVEGQSLRDKLVKEGELPIGVAVRILRDVVDALTEAHAHGVVHRDIKPENILLRGHHALVTDFGVAKAVSEATGREQLTTAGVALGTPAYMAPEQASADPHLDQRVDIYAVGAVAYELLTGRPVFMGTTPQMILSAHMTEPPQPVTKHRDTVPAALESVVMRCLEKRPADRWQSAEELLPHLEALATPSGGVTPIDTRPMAAIPAGRRWLVPGVLAAVAVLVLIVVALPRLLAPSRITITTSNIRAVTSELGMEWQPALSPDGSQVAFVARRSGRQSVVIRSTRSAAGGGETTPTQGLRGSMELFPVWSADGEFVRFVGCPGSIVSASVCSWREVARLGGSIRSIELPRNATLSSWSPDGSRVAFVTLSDSIFTYSISDGTVTLLAVPEVEEALHSPVWSPDGRWIAYVNGNPWWLLSFNVAPSSIWIVAADGGEPVRVSGRAGMNVSPAWLDDRHLLFVSNRDGPREVYVAEVGPTGSHGEPRKVPGVTDPHSVSYSIAGRKLAFSKATVRQNIWSYPIGPGPISIADGQPVTSDNAVIEEHDISPDGRWIAYNQNLRGDMDIYKRLLEGGSPMPITNTPSDEFQPRWSPEGTEIAFYGNVGTGESAVMVVGADGGTPVLIASGQSTWYPEWSPSGLEIAFYSRQTGRAEVWLASRDGVGGSWGDATQLTDFGCSPDDWAPDGSGVLCRAGRELVLVSREGEVLWRHDLSRVRLRGLNDARFSRDGSTIYVYGTHEDGSEGIWAIPPQGGEPLLMVAFDDPEIRGLDFLSVGPDHLYVTVGQYEVDIWVMDLEW
jgi:Tol biopolymer transport system component/tRNA A-37 threonylcarbamoyl transferase component Bud32